MYKKVRITYVFYACQLTGKAKRIDSAWIGRELVARCRRDLRVGEE